MSFLLEGEQTSVAANFAIWWCASPLALPWADVTLEFTLVSMPTGSTVTVATVTLAMAWKQIRTRRVIRLLLVDTFHHVSGSFSVRGGGLAHLLCNHITKDFRGRDCESVWQEIWGVPPHTSPVSSSRHSLSSHSQKRPVTKPLLSSFLHLQLPQWQVPGEGTNFKTF